MEASPDVIAELRCMFKEGATPSRLIRHVVERHDGEGHLFSLIQSCFREAFGIPIVRGLSPVDDYQHADLRYAFLNQQLLHEMIEKRGEWDNDDSESWLDSLTATDDDQRINQVRNVVPGELSRFWTQMTPKEREYIQVMFASSHGMSETIKIMSRLLESLQQQVNELQVTPAGASSV